MGRRLAEILVVPALLLSVVLLASGCTRPALRTASAGDGLPVLCLASEDTAKQGLTNLDPAAVAAYRTAGFDLHFGFYQRVTPAELAHYPVVIGMVPQLHAGTQAISAEVGAALAAHIRAGNGFLLIPAPSYYGGENFHKLLNPWLAEFGAELLNEPPQDPAHQVVHRQVLGYRYLRAETVSHPVTAGVPAVWLPLDFTDSYIQTHTMRVSDAWQVLVRGSGTCRTCTFASLRHNAPVTGTYASAPPFLAVRNVELGRMALFTTASGYFLYDAFHPAYHDAFVLREGGLKLMANLLRYLAANAPAPVPFPSSAPAAATPVAAAGNVPVCVDKDEWLGQVQQRLMPRGMHVHTYIDCGSLADLPYRPERGYGYIADSSPSSWLIRWGWAEWFHETGANSRGFNRGTLRYRFDHLQPERRYRLGLLLWAYQEESAGNVRVSAAGHPLAADFALPRFADRQGPRFELLDVPPEAIVDGTFVPEFSLAPGGTGSFASVSELWLFEEGGAARLDPVVLRQRFEPPDEPRQELPFARSRFSGLIGARSRAADESSVVGALCAAAQASGLDFLIFTDPLKELDATGLARLREECRQASTQTFLAVPGITFADSAKPEAGPAKPLGDGSVNVYVFGAIEQLPSPADFGNPYSLLWKFFGGEFCGGQKCEPTLLQPGKNGISPFYQRFWRGFNVLTFGEDGSPVDDSRALFADVMASGYGPRPRVSGVYRTADDIRRAAANGWRVWIEADQLSRLVPYSYTSAVSSGPVIETLAYSGDHARWSASGEGLLFRGQCWLNAHIGVHASAPLQRISLFRDRAPVRVWYPSADSFQADEPVLVTGQHEFWLKVEDSKGGEAISGRFLVQDLDFSVGMCSDNQNTITNLFRPPATFELREGDMYLAHSYWHTGEAAGQLGVMRPAADLVPRIIETGIIQPVKHFLPCPVIRRRDGQSEDHNRAELRIRGASRDFYELEYRFAPSGAATQSTTLLTAFRPVPGGATAVLAETRLRAPAGVDFADSAQAVRWLSVATMPTLPADWNWTVADEAGKVTATGTFAALTAAKDLVLPPRGAVLLWPNELGNLFVLSLVDRELELRLELLPNRQRGREFVSIGERSGNLPAGTERTNRFLVAWVPDTVAAPADIRRIRERFLSGGLALAGVATADYVTDVTAANHVWRGAVVASRPDGVPLRVRGLNPNWSILRFQGDRPWPVTSTHSGADAVTLIPAATGKTPVPLMVGHPVVADQAGLRLEWAGQANGRVKLRVHNPEPQPVTATLSTLANLPGMPAVRGTVTLIPGESAWVVGTRETGFVKENFLRKSSP